MHKFILKPILAARSVALVCFLGTFSFTPFAHASEDGIRALFIEAESLIEYTDAEMAKIVAELGVSQDDQTDSRRLRDYELSKAEIAGLGSKIGETPNWKRSLPLKLSRELRDLAEGFAYADKAVFDQAIGKVFSDQRTACLSVHEDLAETVGAINAALGAHTLYSQESREAVRPYRPKVDARLADYEQATAANKQAYYDAADRLNLRRGELARRLWRFYHAYGAAGLEKEQKEIRAALYSSLGMQKEAHVNPVRLAMHFTTFQSNANCPFKLGTLTQYESNAWLPKVTAFVSDRITEPVRTFDEREHFLQPPDAKGNSQLERVANSLSHRQVQRFRLLGAIEQTTGKLKTVNAAYLDTAKIDARLAELSTDYETLAAPFIPELEHRGRYDKMLEDIEGVENEIARIEQDIASERQAQIEAATEARLTLFIQTGSDANDIETFRRAEPGERGRTVSEILKPIQEDRNGHVKRRDEAQSELDAFMDYGLKYGGLSPNEKLQRYKTLKAKVSDTTRLIDAMDRKIAAIEALRVASDYDETKLATLLDLKERRTAQLKILREKAESVQRQASATQADESARRALYETGQSIAIALEQVRRIDPSQSDLVNRLMPIAERLERDRRSWREAPYILEDLGVLNGNVETLRDGFKQTLDAQRIEALDLRGQLTNLGRKLETVNGTLFSLKKAATLILQRELPTSGIPADDDILTQMSDYQEALTVIQKHLEDGSKTITENADKIDRFYDDFEGALTTDQKLGAQRVVANMKWVNSYVEEIAKTTEMMSKTTGQAISAVQAYQDITQPDDNSPASAFKHISTVLKRGEQIFKHVPVVGVFGEYYFGYLNSTIEKIEGEAKAIRDETVRKLTKKGPDNVCLFRTPEEHLYTMDELTASDAVDVSLMTKWFGWNGRDELIGIQSRRVIALMGADSIGLACEKPADCNAKRTCTQQGLIGWTEQ